MDFVDDPVVDSISSLPGAGTFNSLKVNVINAAITYPVRRDTIMIEKGWTYVLAVKATNPGIWVWSPLFLLGYLCYKLILC
jgi:hypothetical protein